MLLSRFDEGGMNGAPSDTRRVKMAKLDLDCATSERIKDDTIH